MICLECIHMFCINLLNQKRRYNFLKFQRILWAFDQGHFKFSVVKHYMFSDDIAETTDRS